MMNVQSRSPIRNAVGICLLMICATLCVAYVKSGIPDSIAARLEAVHQTVLPARIDAGAQLNVLAEYPGRIRSVDIAAGSRVRKGASLLQLENADLSGQVAAARRRLEIATARVRETRSEGQADSVRMAQSEREAAAFRDRDLAKQRLDAYSLEPAESALASAKRRTVEIQALVGRGLATSAELENARLQEEGSSRDLVAAREHFSRLKQEGEQAESQIRLVQFQTTAKAPETASAGWEVDQVRAELKLAEDRERRLRVIAPGPGTVIDLPVNPGESVLAGTVLARIADLNRLTITAPVSAQIAQRIRVGKHVRVRLPSDPPVRLEARVESVTLAPDSAQRAYLVRTTVPNPNPRIVLAGLEGAIEFDHLEGR
jgi:multidrug resistance efflux pump